ncbi:hypothetical protein KKC44_05055 [Patescibacteria group bacterium]|nr:hypothetical protein [Patescibacteria group bacterium]MBU2259943.1 hypothetical protein [Patescibacteria group bacterium]
METTSQSSADTSEKTPDNEELERTLHLLLRRTRALVAYAKGKCHERGDLVERAVEIESAESVFLNSMVDLSVDPDVLLEEEILDAPYLDKVIALENAIAELPNVTRNNERVSIEALLAKAQILSRAA